MSEPVSKQVPCEGGKGAHGVTFSVITPSFEQGPWLQECLDSVRANSQDGISIEHIVIDGGSRDASLEILQNQDFARWVSEPDRGQTHAINKGFAIASGEIFSYLCSDDILEPGALAAVAEAFGRDPCLDVVYGDGYFLEGDSGWKRLKPVGPFTPRRLRSGNFLIQPSVFWRREVYDRFGPLDLALEFCMDHEYWLRICAETRWHHLPSPLSTCRLHTSAKTSRALPDAWDEAAQMQARYGIRLRPRLDALWMRCLGHHYYRLKRLVFQKMGHHFHREWEP